MLSTADRPINTSQVSHLSTVQISLVVDHEINQELAMEFLSSTGAMLTLAKNGQETYDWVK
ncbi:MAG: hypothetical protein F6K00_08225 [Leptolyngbya sp. SIOISBB]|nr:hypothetical protein [Leptolyngbya sp. SIOISBB]